MCAMGNKRPARLYSLLDKQLFHIPSGFESRITGFDHSIHSEIHGKLKQSVVLCDQISIYSTLNLSKCNEGSENVALSLSGIE